MAYFHQPNSGISEREYTTQLSELMKEINDIYSSHCRIMHRLSPKYSQIGLAESLLEILIHVKRGSKVFEGVDKQQGDPFLFSEQELKNRKSVMLSVVLNGDTDFTESNVTQAMEELCRYLFIHAREVDEALSEIRSRNLQVDIQPNLLEGLGAELQNHLIQVMGDSGHVQQQILRLVSKRLNVSMPNPVAIEQKMDVIFYKMTFNLLYTMMRMLNFHVCVVNKDEYEKLTRGEISMNTACGVRVTPNMVGPGDFEVSRTSLSDNIEVNSFIEHVERSIEAANEIEEEQDAKRIKADVPAEFVKKMRRKKSVVDSIINYRTIDKDNELMFVWNIGYSRQPGDKLATWYKRVCLEGFRLYVLDEMNLVNEKVTDQFYMVGNDRVPFVDHVRLVITRSELKKHVRKYALDNYLANRDRSLAYEHLSYDMGTDFPPFRTFTNPVDKRIAVKDFINGAYLFYRTIVTKLPGFGTEEPPTWPIVIPWKGNENGAFIRRTFEDLLKLDRRNTKELEGFGE